MSEPIAAIATGRTRSAIGVIRLSGDGCIDCAARVFKLPGDRDLTAAPPRELVVGTLLDAAGEPLDQAMAVWFSAPNSYTGEDAVEFHCHGSPTVLTLALESLFAQGVRQALAGEFTKRAFLNGKLDLTRAEAVADLIDAQTPAAARQAAGQLSGALFRRVEAVRRELVDLLAHFHATVDYPDEDLAPFTDAEIAQALDRAGNALAELLATYDRGRVIRQGIPTAIVGRPNAGKSTLLNALVGYDRAIVADLPGTTRDTVEEQCVLGGQMLRLIDTAGIRDPADGVEALGVERSRRAMEEAELIFVVADRSKNATGEDVALLRQAQAMAPTVLIQNKADLPAAPAPLTQPELAPTVTLSAKEGRGLDRLEQAVRALFPESSEPAGEVLVNARQAQCAQQALAALDRAGSAHGAGMPADVVLLDVEEAADALGALTGRLLRQDVVERIFTRFCVGK